MSRHTVKLHGVAVGYSDLEEADASLGRARGRFRPGVGYDLVQPVFRLFTEAVPAPGGDVQDQEKLDRYHRSRDALGLALEDDSGRLIRTSAIHISDYSARKGGSIDVEVLIPDAGYWKRRATKV
ncbi:MAG TPA: hypothetical protein VKH19_18840 [Gemmatimonadaceae bacterium]|nr:hypothetical protein [Gemmatimonadaceae bacterium]